jgi:hypothetical protein
MFVTASTKIAHGKKQDHHEQIFWFTKIVKIISETTSPDDL